MLIYCKILDIILFQGLIEDVKNKRDEVKL